MDEGQTNTMDVLRRLLGKWRGNGIAAFPTIPTFEYHEELEFTANDVQAVVHYEQRTWKTVNPGAWVPSHWESGFWRVLSLTDIEILSAQAGGRVEISRGSLIPTHEGLSVHLESTLLANDARVRKIAREFVLRGNTLHYTMEMSTTAVSELKPHVRAELIRNE